MLEQLRNALAQLVALEARVTELVEPEKAITDSVKAIVLTLAQAHEQIHAQVVNIEAQVRIIGEHPALSIPSLPVAEPRPITAEQLGGLVAGHVTYIGDQIPNVAAVEAAQPKVVDPPRTALGATIAADGFAGGVAPVASEPVGANPPDAAPSSSEAPAT